MGLYELIATILLAAPVIILLCTIGVVLVVKLCRGDWDEK